MAQEETASTPGEVRPALLISRLTVPEDMVVESKARIKDPPQSRHGGGGGLSAEPAHPSGPQASCSQLERWWGFRRESLGLQEPLGGNVPLEQSRERVGGAPKVAAASLEATQHSPGQPPSHTLEARQPRRALPPPLWQQPCPPEPGAKRTALPPYVSPALQRARPVSNKTTRSKRQPEDCRTRHVYSEVSPTAFSRPYSHEPAAASLSALQALRRLDRAAPANASWGRVGMEGGAPEPSWHCPLAAPLLSSSRPQTAPEAVASSLVAQLPSGGGRGVVLTAGRGRERCGCPSLALAEKRIEAGTSCCVPRDPPEAPTDTPTDTSHALTERGLLRSQCCLWPSKEGSSSPENTGQPNVAKRPSLCTPARSPPQAQAEKECCHLAVLGNGASPPPVPSSTLRFHSGEASAPRGQGPGLAAV